MMSLTILCILIIPTTVKYSSIATIFIVQFGKYAVSGATAISWIFVPELFPTSVRSTANGFFIACSRIGAIATPIINASINKDYLSYTFYVSSILAFFVLLLSLILPETKDKPMDDVNITDI
jgi:MFS family permease